MQTKETLTITRIYTTDKDKNGSPLMSKQGKPYTRMSIQAAEYGEKWLGGFKGKVSGDWKVGDKVEVLVGETTGRDGKSYLNFEIPKFSPQDESLNRMMEMIILLRQIAEKVGVQVYGEKKSVDYPEDEIDADDIPF